MGKIFYSIIIVIMLGLTTYIAYIIFPLLFVFQSSSIPQENFKKEDFLHNKNAILYLSTTADQDINGKGLSFAVFIDKDGNSKELVMEGLELGSIAVNNKNIFLEEKNRVRIVGENSIEFPMKTSQYTGERTGFLENKNIFFSIYNSGFNKKGKGYNSDVRYGNEKEFKTGTIPYYIASSGLNGNDLTILTQDVEKNEFNLKEIILDKTIGVNQITRIETPQYQDSSSLSPVLADNKYYYFILSSISNDNNDKTLLYRINKANHKQEVFDFVEYKNVKDVAATYPYNFKNSAYIYKNELYYVDGLGDVYTFNTINKKILKKFTLSNTNHSKIRHNEETYFNEGSLHILRYSEKKAGKYYLEKYSLDSGKLNDTLDIKNLNNLLKNLKRNVYSYDLKVLN